MKSFWVPLGYLLSYMGCSECLNSREEQTEKSIIKYTELNTWCWNTLLKSKKMHLALQQKWLESVWGKYHVCLSFTDAWSPNRGHCQRLQEDMGLPALSAWPKASLPMLYAAPWAAQKLLPPHLTQIRDEKQSVWQIYGKLELQMTCLTPTQGSKFSLLPQCITKRGFQETRVSRNTRYNLRRHWNPKWEWGKHHSWSNPTAVCLLEGVYHQPRAFAYQLLLLLQAASYLSALQILFITDSFPRWFN